jgi:hypothetical protein
MAREVGWGQAKPHDDCRSCGVFDIEAFAALVATAATEAANARANTSWSLMCKKMVAFENEACAKLVDHILKEGGGTYGAAIRARGQA